MPSLDNADMSLLFRDLEDARLWLTSMHVHFALVQGIAQQRGEQVLGFVCVTADIPKEMLMCKTRFTDRISQNC